MFPFVPCGHLNYPEGDSCPLTKFWIFALIVDLGDVMRQPYTLAVILFHRTQSVIETSVLHPTELAWSQWVPDN